MMALPMLRGERDEMAFTYTDSDKVVLEAFGKFKVTLLEAVEPGDLLSWYNTDNAYTAQFADQSDEQRGDCIAVEKGAAGDEIVACLKAVLQTIPTISTGGVVTAVYFAGADDFFGAPLYLGEDGKPSSTQGTTYTQVIGELLARDRILIDLGLAYTGPIVRTISGATALNAVEIRVTDECTNASGYARGLYLSCTVSGTKTSSGEHNALGIDVTVTGDTPYAYIQSLYMATSGNPTIGLISAISIYMDNIGTGVSSFHMLDLQTGNPTASAAATREAYMRCRNHGTGTPTCIMFLQANNNAKVATNFIESGSNNESGPVYPAQTTTGDETYTYKVRCLYGSTTFYLVGVASS